MNRLMMMIMVKMVTKLFLCVRDCFRCSGLGWYALGLGLWLFCGEGERVFESAVIVIDEWPVWYNLG
jgi:hypothetical protein